MTDHKAATATLAAAALAAVLAAGCSKAASAHPVPTVTVTQTQTVTVPAASPSTTALTLSFDCAVTPNDSYTLSVTNSYLFPVTAYITVGFYDASGTEMGEDDSPHMTISPNTTYNYQGTYAQFELGGVPASCREIEWQQQS